jgi:hypothetical protein
MQPPSRGIHTSIGLTLGFGLTILAFGFLWIGQLRGMWFVYAGFAFSAYVLSQIAGRMTPLMSMSAGAVPLSLLMVQFRDANDSHLMSILTVVGWYAAIVLGALAADRPRTSFTRFLLWMTGFSFAHAVLAILLVLFSFGASMQAFDAGIAPPTGFDWAGVLLEPALSLWSAAPRGEARWVQWLLFAATSATWGTFLALLYALVRQGVEHRYGRPLTFR